MERIEYYREGQGRGAIVCRPEQVKAELARLIMDEAVVFEPAQVRRNHRRMQ